MAELVLVRHGQTEWSRDGRHTGRSDLPLTDAGERDAAALRGRLDRPFALVLTSPLQRAARTAQLAGLGETLEQVAARQRRVIARVRPVLERDEDACLVGHGHALRILAACWLGFEPIVGKQLVLTAGKVSTLGFEHGSEAVLSWNA